jgi:Skp family chaperone for outer membrane proteins
MLRTITAFTVAAALALPALSAAQTAPPASGQNLGGPLIPGVCMLSREAVFTSAKIGQAATARLKLLADQAQAEVDGDRAPLELEAKTIEGQKASLSATALKARQDALAPKVAALQQKATLRSREIDATRAKAVAKIAQEAQPMIEEVYRSHKCGVLLSRDAVLGGNVSADLTAAVVQALDSKVATITFDREVLASGSPQANAIKR